MMSVLVEGKVSPVPCGLHKSRMDVPVFIGANTGWVKRRHKVWWGQRSVW